MLWQLQSINGGLIRVHGIVFFGCPSIHSAEIGIYWSMMRTSSLTFEATYSKTSSQRSQTQNVDEEA